MPVIQRPELSWVTLRVFDEPLLLVASRVGHRLFSLCEFKREALEAGYEEKTCAKRLSRPGPTWQQSGSEAYSI